MVSSGKFFVCLFFFLHRDGFWWWLPRKVLLERSKGLVLGAGCVFGAKRGERGVGCAFIFDTFYDRGIYEYNFFLPPEANTNIFRLMELLN